MCLGSLDFRKVRTIRSILDESINDLITNHRDVLCNDPLRDFIRSRSFTPEKIIRTLLSFGSKNTESELVILAIVILSSITIFISALIPAIKASNVMPVDAMRQTNIVKVRAGKLKTNPFIKNIFGYEGVLACKNIKRNGVKGTVIVISLAISVIMFLTIDFFDKTFVKINEYEIDLPFDMYVSCAPDEKDRLMGELEALPEVDRVVDYSGLPAHPGRS